jgi:hypothetical protein
MALVQADSVDFDTLFRSRKWTPIRNCPGRFGLADGPTIESPSTLAPADEAHEFSVPTAKDAVVVVPFHAGGGLISYKRAGGSYLHTLNTADGFARKLADLGITLRPRDTRLPKAIGDSGD